jgi:hypothetical protein
MAPNDYYFFTDAKKQADDPANYIKVQAPTDAYGPVTVGAALGMDEYRVTSLHSASFNPTAYAACDGIVCVQKIPNTTLVNIILKPLVQPALNFAPIKYIIYKGILSSSLISGTDVAAPGNNDLAKFVWTEQAKKNSLVLPIAAPPAEALGVGLTAAAGSNLADTEPIDHLFYRSGVAFQLPVVKGGWSLGSFEKTGFGLEVLMEGLAFRHPLLGARRLRNTITVASLSGSETPAQVFDHWHEKEQILGYIDPCAFYGSFFLAGIKAKSSTDATFSLKTGNALYQELLFPFANKTTAYLDIRNEHSQSLDYFKNYGSSILISYDPSNAAPAPTDYYGAKWPILTLPASVFPVTNTTKAHNPLRIQLPVGDNPEPLVYVSQGYRDISSERTGFPPELSGAERFYDAFQTPVGGFTATKDTSGLDSLTFVVPNVTGQGVTTPVSCYIRLKYLKQKPGVATAPTVIQFSNYLDNLIYPLDLRTLFAGSAAIRTAVYDEEIYVNAQQVSGLKYDFIGKLGIARDNDNTVFFLLPDVIHKSAGAASTMIALPSQTSDYAGSYFDVIAAQYPGERVQRSGLLLGSDTIPIADFVTDSAAGGFTSPDFSKLIAIAVSNTTYEHWRTNLAPLLDGRFRTYLGVTNLQSQIDDTGIPYSSFELVLRGFKLDAGTSSYRVVEINTEPAVLANNVRVYAHAEIKTLAITSLTLLDITNEPLRFLSAAPHPYFGGNTRVHGTVTVEGSDQDALQTLVLEVLQGGEVVATGTLAPGPSGTLIRAFGAAEKVEVAHSQLLFNLSSATLAGINVAQDGTLGLRVRAQSTNGQEATRNAQSMQILGRYTGNNRYGDRDEARGGDDWARPSVLALLAQPVGISYGDMSNMNGGQFPPHQSHRDGLDVDGWYAGYNARDAAAAQMMIAHLNAPYGSAINRVFVTFTASPANAFFNAIQGVVLNDGRTATNVIRPVAGHTTHFHWRFGP